MLRYPMVSDRMQQRIEIKADAKSRSRWGVHRHHSIILKYESKLKLDDRK
jgi:hypothetical protein